MLTDASDARDERRDLRAAAMRLTATLALAALAVTAGTALAAVEVPPETSHDGFSVGRAQQFFTSEFGDALSSIYLNEIFGPLFPSADRTGTSHATTFSTIIGYFNIVALGLGGLLFAWNATAGLMQTAHEGELLGRRWSSLWAPVRVVFAVGLLVPIPGLGGYNAAQAGVAYVVRGTTMTASFMWSVAAGTILADDIPVAAAQPRTPPEVVETMYRIAACQVILEHQLAAMGDSRGFVAVADLETRRVGADLTDIIEAQRTGWVAPAQYYRKRRTVEIRDFDDPSDAEQVCGWWETPVIAADMAAYLADSGLTDAQVDRVLALFRDGHIDTMTELYEDLLDIAREKGAVILSERHRTERVPRHEHALAEAYIEANGALGRLSEDIFRAVGTFEGKTGETNRGRRKLAAITGGPECAPAELAAAQDLPRCFGQGWVMAGSWYMHIARLNGQVTAFMRAAGQAEEDPFFRDLDEEEVQAWYERGWNRVVRFFDRPTIGKYVDSGSAAQAMAAFRSAWELDAERLAGLGFPAKLVTEPLPEDHDWSLSDLAAKLTGADLEDAIDWIGEFVIGGPGEDPLVHLIAWGDSLLLIAAGIMTVLLFVPGAAILVPLVGVLWGAGALLQLILPMMPWILWVVAVTGYFLLVVEAVIGVSLWAFAHLRLDGEGISGAATNGWTLLLALLLTPVLMILGFVIGMVIFRVTSGLLLSGIAPAAHAVLAPASVVTQVVALPAIALVIAVMQLILIERSFSLVTELPNRVLNWIGARADLADQGALDRARLGMIGATAGIGRGAQSLAGHAPAAGGPFRRALGRLGRLRRPNQVGNDTRPTGD